MPIEHEGKKYFSQEELDSAITGRLKNLNTEVETLKTKAGEADTWREKATQAEARAAQAETARARATAASKLGITDDDNLWLLEQSHARTMESVPEAQRVAFEAWLPSVVQDPSLAPAAVRLLLPGQGIPQTTQPQPQTPDARAPQTQAPGTKVDPPTPTTPTRPVWAPSINGQTPTQPGGGPDLVAAVRGTKTLEELAALRQAQNGGR